MPLTDSLGSVLQRSWLLVIRKIFKVLTLVQQITFHFKLHFSSAWESEANQIPRPFLAIGVSDQRSHWFAVAELCDIYLTIKLIFQTLKYLRGLKVSSKKCRCE